MAIQKNVIKIQIKDYTIWILERPEPFSKGKGAATQTILHHRTLYVHKLSDIYSTKIVTSSPENV